MKRTKKEKHPLPPLSADAERLLSPDARYALRVRRFNRFYWTLVVCMGSVVALATVVAVFANVLVGLCAAVAVAALYCYFKKDALRRHLHLSCASADDGLSILSLSAEGEDVLFVPDRLMGLPVRALGNAPFDAEANAALKTLRLPDTLRTPLSKDFLVGLDMLETIRFAGSANAWARLAGDCVPSTVTVTYDDAYPDVAALSLIPENGEEGEVSV